MYRKEERATTAEKSSEEEKAMTSDRQITQLLARPSCVLCPSVNDIEVSRLDVCASCVIFDYNNGCIYYPYFENSSSLCVCMCTINRILHFSYLNVSLIHIDRCEKTNVFLRLLSLSLFEEIGQLHNYDVIKKKQIYLRRKHMDSTCSYYINMCYPNC